MSNPYTLMQMSIAPHPFGIRNTTIMITWEVFNSISNRLEVFHQSCLRRILKIRFYEV